MASGNVYDTSCNVYTTYSQPSTVSVCDSSDFYCTFGTTEIDQFDDPTTGWAYNCTADAVEESCAGNLIIDCVSFPMASLQDKHFRVTVGIP